MTKQYDLIILLFVFLLQGSFTTFSQNNPKTDSLKNVLSELANTEVRVDVLNSLSEHYRQHNPNESMIYAQKAYNLSAEIEYPKGQVDALRKLGAIYSRRSDYERALNYAFKADSIANENDLLLEKIGIEKLIGTIFIYIGNFERASIHLFQGLKIAEESGDKESISSCLSSIGLLYDYQQNFEKAYEYYANALAISREISDKKGIAREMNNLANAAWYLGETDTYEKNMREAIVLNKELNQQYWLLMNYYNLGDLFFETGQLDSAIIYTQYAYKIADELGDLTKMSRIKTAEAKQQFRKTADVKLAIGYANQAFELAESTKSKKEIFIASSLLSYLYEIDNNIDSLYKYSTIKFQLKDSLNIERENNKLAQLEMKYLLDKQALVLERSDEKVFLRMVIVSGILFFILLITLVLHYRSRVKSKTALLENQEKADDQLRESEAKFRDIFNSMVDVFSRSDMSGKCVMISPSIYNLIGYTAEEIIGTKLADYYANPKQRKEIVNQLQKSKRAENFEIDILAKDGSIVTVSANAKVYYDSNGTSLGIESVFRDITEQKATESQYNKLFSLSQDLIAIAGFDGYFKNVNPAWEKITGYSTIELTSKPFIEFIYEADRDKTINEFSALLEGAVTLNFDNRYVTKEGDLLDLSWTATPMEDDKLIYCIARDITIKKRNEQSILVYQKRLKDLATEITITEEKVRKQIASDLHDDVGQLLTSGRMLLTRATGLVQNNEVIKRLNSVSKILLKASQSTRAAIFNLRPPQLGELGLCAATHDWAKEQIESKHGIKVTVTVLKNKLELDEKSELLLFRSLQELMNNVVKHAKASRLNVDFQEKDDQLKIIVEDNGTGFDYNPDSLKIMSNRFGLFSIQERVTDLGGEMIVSSTKGVGTIITIFISTKENN